MLRYESVKRVTEESERKVGAVEKAPRQADRNADDASRSDEFRQTIRHSGSIYPTQQIGVRRKGPMRRPRTSGF